MTNSIEIRDIAKTYVSVRSGESVEALSGVTLDIKTGEFLAVVGPSGCGKSTLLSIIAGLDKATSGEALHNGNRITGPERDRGVLFQDYALFPWLSVLDNVSFGPRAAGLSREQTRSVSQRMINTVGLKGFEDKLPHELSGGMRQRCALARMLTNQPHVWLMDEPLAAVDLQTRTILQEELLRIWGETAQDSRPTVVFVTHGIEEAVVMADRVVVLGRRPGRVKEIVDIDLPRPRFEHRDATREAALIDHIWTSIRDEAAAAIADR